MLINMTGFPLEKIMTILNVAVLILVPDNSVVLRTGRKSGDDEQYMQRQWKRDWK